MTPTLDDGLVALTTASEPTKMEQHAHGSVQLDWSGQQAIALLREVGVLAETVDTLAGLADLGVSFTSDPNTNPTSSADVALYISGKLDLYAGLPIEALTLELCGLEPTVMVKSPTDATLRIVLPTITIKSLLTAHYKQIEDDFDANTSVPG